MTAIRRAAQNERCTLRTPICNGDTRTTVLCHYRMFGVAGMGQKPPDLFAGFGCSDCHSRIDGRVRKPEMTREDRYWYILRSIMETHQRLVELGVLKIQ